MSDAETGKTEAVVALPSREAPEASGLPIAPPWLIAVAVIAALLIGLLLGRMLGKKQRTPPNADVRSSYSGPKPDNGPAAPSAMPQSPAAPGGPNMSQVSANVQQILSRLDAIEKQMARLASISAGPASSAAGSKAARAQQPATSAPPSPDALLSESASTAEADAKAKADAYAERQKAESALASYREMLDLASQPAFSEWRRQHEAVAFAVDRDGSGRPVDEALESYVLAIAAGPEQLFVVPNGDIINNFSTRFNSLLVAKEHLGASFDLETDGGGKLKLVKPAIFVEQHGQIALQTRGQLGGFKE